MKKQVLVISLCFFLIIPSSVLSQFFEGVYFEMLDTYNSDVEGWTQKKYGANVKLLKDKNTSRTYDGWIHESYSMTYKGIPLEFSCVKVHKKDGCIVSLNGDIYVDSINVNIVPTITEDIALQRAMNFLQARKYSWEESIDYVKSSSTENKPRGQLVICPSYSSSSLKRQPCLAYKFNIKSVDPFNYLSMYVDATDGKIVHINSLINYSQGTADTRYSGTQIITTEKINNLYYLHDVDRGIYTYNNHCNMPNNISSATDFTDNDNFWLLTEYHNGNKDDAALDAHWGAMMTYDYFYNTFGRNSLDDEGMAINGYVHTLYPGKNVNSPENARWIPTDEHGAGYITYGDGWVNRLPDAFTSLDIVAHELGHGITSNTAKLQYSWEPGAINESISDIWGACVENYVNIGKSIWLCGEDIYRRDSAFRNMSDPKEHGQPDTYQGENWVSYPPYTLPNNDNDNCGVHTNSGVMNYWFYLLSIGGSGINDNNYNYTVQGIGIENAARVVYNALCNYFCPYTNYTQAAILTRASAVEIFGLCSSEVQSVTDAWKAVGVPIEDIPDILNLTETINSSVFDKYYFAYSLITTTNTIKPDAAVNYFSSNKIVFLPGFRAERGCSVMAKIIECQEGSSSSSFLQAPNITNIKDEAEKCMQKVSLSPNPVVDFLYIEGLNTEKASFVIYDSLGKLVKVGTIYAPLLVNVVDLPKGTYVLRIKHNESLNFYKFIKN